MSTLTTNITLDENLKTFVEADVAEGGFASVSEYMRNLIQKRRADKLEYDAAVAKFKKLIQDGIDSGPGRPWEEHKADLIAKIERHRLQTIAAASRSA